LSRGLKADLSIWSSFLDNWNGVSYFPSEGQINSELHLYTDASGNIGCAGSLNSAWFSFPWPKDFVLNERKKNDSIALRELIPVVIACLTWASTFSSRTVILHCDNQSVVEIINARRSRVVVLNRLLRTLVLSELTLDYTVTAVYIPTEENIVADSLSRLDFQRFRLALPSADMTPTVIPTGVLQRVWTDVTLGTKGLTS